LSGWAEAIAEAVLRSALEQLYIQAAIDKP